MKKSFALLALGLMTVGSVACSSAPKQEEQKAAEPAVVEQPAASVSTPDTQSNTSVKPDLSLGASSSGRGH